MNEEDRHKYTPKMTFDSDSNACLIRPDGKGRLQLEMANYVIITDKTHPSGERLMVSLDSSGPKYRGHADLAGGNPVKYTGCISTDDSGRIVDVDELNCETGHYMTPFPEQGEYIFSDNPDLPDYEKEKLAKSITERGKAFRDLLIDKFRPFIENADVNHRPGTPPLDLQRSE